MDNKEIIYDLDSLVKKIINVEKNKLLADLNVIDEVMTVKEAAELWNKHPTTIVKVITTTNKLTKDVDYKKSAGTWLITKKAMKTLYGEI